MQQAVTDVNEALEAIIKVFYQEAYKPHPERTDWSEHIDGIRGLERDFRDRVLPAAAQISPEVEPEDEAEQLTSRAVLVGLRIVVLLSASGYVTEARMLLQQLKELPGLTASPIAAAAIGLADRDLTQYTWFQYGLWLLQGDRGSEAVPVFRHVAKATRDPELAERAQHAAIRAKPLSGAPMLSQFMVIGAGMYGSRDRIGDTKVSTHWITVLGVPILPLAAYRVVDHENGSYTFLDHEPLSPFAIWYRRALLAAVAIAVIGFAL